jgi:hypothetical protein
LGQRAARGYHWTDRSSRSNRECDYNQNRSEPG